jgi:GAF domain
VVTTVLLVIGGYVVFVACVLAVLTAAKRADEAMEQEPGPSPEAREAAEPARSPSPPPVEALPAYDALGRLAGDVRGALGAKRIAVVVSDPGDPGSGTVVASLGAPELLGSHVRISTDPASGAPGPDEARILGIGHDGRPRVPWRFARVPMAAHGHVVGVVAVAARRPRAFTRRDITFLERLAGRAAYQLDDDDDAAPA